MSEAEMSGCNGKEEGSGLKAGSAQAASSFSTQGSRGGVGSPCVVSPFVEKWMHAHIQCCWEGGIGHFGNPCVMLLEVLSQHISKE